MATKKKVKNCVEIYRDRVGEWRWRAVARNGKIIADGAEGYASKANAKRAVVRFWSWVVTASSTIAETEEGA